MGAPVAQWTTPEPSPVAQTATASGTSPGTTILVAEISSLKTKLEAAARDASTRMQRLAELEKQAQASDSRAQAADSRAQDAEARAQAIEARAQAAEARARTAESRTASAENRAQESEQALHDLSGKNAVENMASYRKIMELEHKVSELRQQLAGVAGDFHAEIGSAEAMVATLRAKAAKYRS